jgi:hypothetical protein
MPDKKRPNDLVNFGALPDTAPPKGTTAPKRSLTREEAEAMMKKAGQKKDTKKYAAGGMTGLPQAAAMSGRTMPTMPTTGAPAMSGLANAAAMSGRTMPTMPPTGRRYAKGGSVTRGDGMCTKGHTKGRMV